MAIVASHKIRLNPTPEQAEFLRDSADVARFTWNWALGWYNEGVPMRNLKLEFNRLRSEGWYEFVGEIPSHTNQQAFTDLNMAINRYFTLKKRGDLKPPKKWRPRKDGKPFGWPKFKSRHRDKPSFYQVGSNLKIDGHWLRMPKLKTAINMTEELRYEGKVNSARFSYSGGYWWASFSVTTNDNPPKTHKNPNSIVGVDLGVSHLAFLHDSETGSLPPIGNPKPLQKALEKLAKLQRKYDGQQRADNPDNYNEDGTAKKGAFDWIVSNRMRKTLLKIQRAHMRVANIRNDAAHKMTHQLACDYGVIGIEDLSIKDLMMNGDMPRSLADAALYEKRRQLQYKSEWCGGRLLPLEAYFPSNQLCQCGCKNGWVTYKMIVWVCEECQRENHRRENSAKNIYEKAIDILNNEAVLPGSSQ